MDETEWIQPYAKALPSKWIDSRYGKVTFWDFLWKEKKSFERHGRKAKVENGQECYLLANKIA
jgi:hypothetical protein